MTSKEIVNIEHHLGVHLPGIYKDWALLLPPVESETESWHWAFNDPINIIEINEELRRDGCHGEEWGEHLFCIGEADGNYYFIDLEKPKPSVYYTNHDDGPYYKANDWEQCLYSNAEDFFGTYDSKKDG